MLAVLAHLILADYLFGVAFLRGDVENSDYRRLTQLKWLGVAATTTPFSVSFQSAI
jgi:hypothetical protein